MLTKKSKFTKIDRLRPTEPTLNLAYRPVNASPSFAPRPLHSRSPTHTKTKNQPCLSPPIHVSNLRLVLRQKHDDPLDVNVASVSDLAVVDGQHVPWILSRKQVPPQLQRARRTLLLLHLFLRRHPTPPPPPPPQPPNVLHPRRPDEA